SLSSAGIIAACLTLYAWRAHTLSGNTSVRVERSTTARPSNPTVAVLPFENLSADPGDGFLAGGVAESVLHRLSSSKELAVISRTSSFVFQDRNTDAREIGRRLNARYLVEGSVQRAGERLRVTARLLDSTTGSDVWSLRFDRQMGDIFALQDEIADKV